jgi:DNA topoisomerase-1
VKGAQEAHEAIRPTSIRREPEAVRRYLSPDQHRLYNLVWQRMVASQMADALFDVTTADIEAGAGSARESYLLRASNTQLRFPGFRQVYVEGRDDGEEEDTGSNPLPPLTAGDALRLLGLNPEQHFTEPPPRYTEATLVKALEEKGIGRPSTYAPIMSTIQDRGYAERDGRYLKPTDLGLVVNDLLVDHFPEFVDVGFTAEMESELDDVAGGERKWQPVVQGVYKPLEEKLAVAAREAPKQVQETEEVCPECGKPMVIRWGRRGRFLACSGFPECRFTRPLEGEEQEAQVEATEEACPECSAPMVVRTGRFGRFLACSRYPECKGSKPILAKTGVKCPRDGGDLLERRTRKGRTFYGCSNYPRCDFTVWARPFSQPCPKCGSLIVAERDGKAKCTSCTWRGQAPDEARAAATVT